MGGGVIYITDDIDTLLEEIRKDIAHTTIIDRRDREFLLKDANEAIERAYITTSTLEEIILIASKFSIIAQNKLLKILEEPPKNKEFILITKSKASLLPTIKSRLPIKRVSTNKESLDLRVDLDNLSFEWIYKFLKDKKRISKLEAKEILEHISKEVLKSKNYKKDKELLDYLTDSLRALELNSTPIFILSGLFLKLLEYKID